MVNGGLISLNSEQWLDANNVCLLSSVNIAPYGTEYYDETLFDLFRMGMYLLDAFRRYEYDEERSPNPIQRKKLIDIPRIGLGVTGLADRFINKQIVYGSSESIEDAKNIFRSLAAVAYKTSYEIAVRDGCSFTAYDSQKYLDSAYIQRLLNEGVIDPKWLNMQAHVCKITVAPTGTLSEIAECGGSGIEPIFSKYFVRRERATTGDFKEWFTFNHAVREYLEKNNVEITKENADKLIDDYWVTAHNIDNMDKINLISTIQQYIDSAISVTYNLPKDATVDDIKDIYFTAWKKQLKGVTVFRDGCKPGILITEENYQESLKEKVRQNRFSPIRPENVECDIYERMVNKERHIVLVGLVENKPYEIFVTNDPENKIDISNYKKGYIVKVKKGRYDLKVVNEKEETILEDISKVFDKKYGSLSRLISMSLRHKVPIPFICDQLSKDKQFDSFEKAVSRTLKSYIEEGVKVLTSETCPECGNVLYYNGGCKTCTNCFWSKCD
jgi:ribonucleoside-diphosphate reductase alpha chain